jgi:SSS family solute:Na+ symporter
VQIGKITIIVALILAIIIAPFLGIDKKGGFQYIQEYTGFVSGVFAMFLLGLFWKKTTANAALFATIGGFIFSIVLKVLPAFINLSVLYSIGFAVPNAQGVFEIPFIDRMSIVFVACIIGMYFISIYDAKRGVKTNGMQVALSEFKTTVTFTLLSITVILILVVLYTVFW